MTGLLKSLPDILKAVTDPFSLLALMVLVLGFIAYPIAKSVPSDRRSLLPAPVIALSIIAIAFVALAFNILRVNALKPSDSSISPRKYNIQVVFRGTKVRHQPVTVPFRTSSGQLNVGCGESASTTVSWNLPQGATEPNAAAAWENTDNVQGHAQQASVSGNVATATGTIRGRDREWLGNCPGGGHGQLVLKGTYVIDQGGPDEEVVLKTYQDIVPFGEGLRVPIPIDSDPFPSLCEITAAGQNASGALLLRLKRSSDGQNTFAELRRTGSLDLNVAVDGGNLYVELRNK